jgi:UDP-3-O-[3-hydroxymyristoyl] N-acetylglucosamine deacetylase
MSFEGQFCNMSDASTDTIMQKTLASAVDCSGVGLHTGRVIRMTLSPAAPNSGIVFKRTDIDSPQALIPATYDNVTETRLCTTVANEFGVSVATIEHLMAALAGFGIDNALITLDGPEVPIMDGSSISFVFLLECAGQLTQPATKSFIQVLKPITVQDGLSKATISPSDQFEAHCEIDFDTDVISYQTYDFILNNNTFKSELARARTFGLLKDVEALRQAGLALGGSLDNAIVIDNDKVLNEGGLRYKDEFVRHKTLDILGDLYLAGAQIFGSYAATRPSHALNNMLLHALLSDDTAWCFKTQARALKTDQLGAQSNNLVQSHESLAYVS